MARRKPRKLGAEEEELWNRVARTARPLGGRAVTPPAAGAPDAPASESATVPLRTPLPTVARQIVTPILPAAPRTRVMLAGEPVRDLGPSTPGLDRRTADRLRRGKTEPQARVDLHGHTLERAHGVLTGFISRAHGQGLRCVLVITGKGKPREEAFHQSRNGVLKDSVPRWLSLPPLAMLVVGVYPAHAKHGGGGAFYVYLRRRR